MTVAEHADKIDKLYASNFGAQLFNLYTQRRVPDLILSKRCQVIRAMLGAMLTAEAQAADTKAGQP